MARVAESTCKICGTTKVAMRNAKGAPFLGCPVCRADKPAPTPEPDDPAPAPQPEPQPKPRRWGRTFFHFAQEGE